MRVLGWYGRCVDDCDAVMVMFVVGVMFDGVKRCGRMCGRRCGWGRSRIVCPASEQGP